MSIGRDAKFTGREIKPRGVEAVFVEREGAEVVIARGIELVGSERGAGREDARELTADEFAGFGGFGLVDMVTGGEELGDVVVERRRGRRPSGGPGVSW